VLRLLISLGITLNCYFTKLIEILVKILYLSNVAGKSGGGVSQVVKALLPEDLEFRDNRELWFLGNKVQEVEISNACGMSKNSVTAIGNSVSCFPYFYRKLRNIGKNKMIIHQHGIFLPISLLSLTSPKNVKVIISPHGYLEPEKMKVSLFKKKIVLGLFEGRNLRNSSALVACSAQEALSIRNFGLPQPIAIIPNGVDEALTRKSQRAGGKEAFKKKYLVKGDVKILLFLSRIHPFKGLKLLLRAIVAIKSEFYKNKWVFIIAGIDENNHEDELKAFVVENNLEDIVLFVGPQYDEDKIQALDAADCFILPSKGENFGIVVIEALVRGLPVITTMTTPWKALITLNCGWWVERSQESFQHTLLEMFAKDGNDLISMGENGRELVLERYTWPKIREQTRLFYKWVENDFKAQFCKGFTLFKS